MPNLIVAITLSVFLLSSAIARAEPDTGDSVAYRTAIDSAIEEFGEGNFAEAREHFARAHGIAPNARTLRGLGMSEFMLRNYVDSVDKLEQALASPVKRLEGTLREETQKLLGRAKAYVGEVQLRLEPPNGELRVDGFPVTLNPNRRLRLTVGDHVLEFAAEGRLAERRAIKVRGEQAVELEVKLAKIQDESDGGRSAGTRDIAPDAPQPVYKKWWLWTTVGVVVVGGVLAGVLLPNRDPKVKDPFVSSTGNTFALE